jgi:hypothetical protein
MTVHTKIPSDIIGLTTPSPLSRRRFSPSILGDELRRLRRLQPVNGRKGNGEGRYRPILETSLLSRVD